MLRISESTQGLRLSSMVVILREARVSYTSIMEADITFSQVFTSKFVVEDTAAGLGPTTAFSYRACSVWRYYGTGNFYTENILGKLK